uniref:NADH dehydrogenase subunit 4L n=1 Tax=Ptychadena anchietae TaxID=127654 RepID=UPI00286B6409|nr:NADH dehydrogenase subunit 4L [Ptychadena anchietae]WKT09021.1 NADH dehydrogenase subunit 4L [Ptychadena anchietae]
MSLMLLLVPLIGIVLNRAHLLSALLCLEAMMFVIYLSLALGVYTPSCLIFPLIVLTLSACDAGLGLSLMVATARSHASDNLKTLHLLQW